LGVGVWGIGAGAQTPNPQSPIPNPQNFISFILFYLEFFLILNYILFIIIK
jgi:hypothetical protein